MKKVMDYVPKQMQQYAAITLPPVLDEAKKNEVTKEQLAYILATVEHESRMGQWMEEGIYNRKKYNKNYYDSKYSNRADLGNRGGSDGSKFMGRGFVQLTGRRNYAMWSHRLGVDLVSNPKLATKPSVAAKILVGGMLTGSFTGKRLSTYVNNRKEDFINARKTVNGTDKASLIAKIAKKYLYALNK